MLWNRSLVMIDSETKSLWSQLLGKAMRGPLEDTELEILPGLMTDWKTWRTSHPNTTVVTLPRTSKQFQNKIYRRPDQFVVGLAQGDFARHWRFRDLVENPVMNSKFRDRPLVVAYAKESGTAFLYDRRVDEQTLTFMRSEKPSDRTIVDKQTKTRWEIASGAAIEGPLAGKSLKLIPGIVSFGHSWMAFHPDSKRAETSD